MARHAVLWVLLCTTAGPAAGESSANLARLEAAVDRFPDDRDLAWARARELARQHRADEAMIALRGLTARWPGHFDAQLELGSLLSARGRYAEAMEPLERAIGLDPGSGTAHLLLGVVFEEVGRFAESEQQFVEAAVLEPALRAESLLLRGTAQLEHGDPRTGMRLLEEAIEADPLGDVADAARVLLGTAARRERPRLAVEAYAGLDYDSNVTLDSGSTPAVSTDQSDGAVVVGAAITGDLLRGDDYRVDLVARYHERDYFELIDFDQRTILGALNGQWRFGSRVAARLGVLGSYVMLGEASYLAQAIARPEIVVWLGERAGVLQIGAHVEGDFYSDDPPISSLERDAITFGGSLAQTLPVPWLRGGQASFAFAYDRVQTDASTDALGFEGDYDRNVYAFDLAAGMELPFEVMLSAQVGVAGEVYDNANLTDYLAQIVSTGTGAPRSRSDLVLETGIGFLRPITEHLDVEVRWRYQQRFSNTEIFDYDRNIVGAGVRVHSF